jgi:PAS domain S-box-containing protein
MAARQSKAYTNPPEHRDRPSGYPLKTANSTATTIRIIDSNFRIVWSTSETSRSSRLCYRATIKRNTPCEQCLAEMVLAGKRVEKLEVWGGKKSSKRFLIAGNPFTLDHSPSAPVFMEIVQELTEGRQVEEELDRVNELNYTIIENAPVAIFTISKEGVFTSVNPALGTVSGLGEKAAEKLIGLNWVKNPLTIRSGLAAHIKRGLDGQAFQLWDFPYHTYKADGTIFMDFKGVPLKRRDGTVTGLLCIIEETTERVKTRTLLAQEVKMSAMGKMSASVAHQLNNPLLAVSVHAELGRELLTAVEKGTASKDDMRELRACFEVVEEQSFRCKEIIKDLFDLRKHSGLESARVNINDLLLTIIEAFEKSKPQINVVKELDDHLPFVYTDRDAVRQVFLNIIQNAGDAVDEVREPKIRVATRREGDLIVIEIEDNGMGIPETIIDKIFEPFFTTKETRKGMGLGLTLCYDLLNALRGTIAVENKPRKGSLFRVRLPLSKQEKEFHDTTSRY